MMDSAKFLGLSCSLLFVCLGNRGHAESKGEAPPSSEAPIATIGGKTIPYGELQAMVAPTLANLQNQYDARQRELVLGLARTREQYVEGELDKLVDDRVLASEAAARKTTAEALLAAIKIPAVSDAEVRGYYDALKSQIGQPFETAQTPVRQYLTRLATDHAKRQYLDSLRDKYHAAITREPLREPVDATGPKRGPADAPVTIVEFSDFQCPFCGRFEPVLRQTLAAYPSQVKLMFRHFPLVSLHPDAFKAAEAGVCADAQGKFWEMHDLIYAEQNSLSVDALKDKARRLGLDADQFNHCLDSGQSAAAVKSDGAAADQLGLTGTPSSFVNGRFLNGAATFDTLSALIKDELRRAGLKSK